MESFLEGFTQEEAMIRLISVAFALVVSTSAQATPLAPLHQPDGMITQVREACGAGMHMVNGTCVRTECVQWVAAALNEMPLKQSWRVGE
jgi:hypothetical protein